MVTTFMWPIILSTLAGLPPPKRIHDDVARRGIPNGWLRIPTSGVGARDTFLQHCYSGTNPGVDSPVTLCPTHRAELK